MADTKFDYNDIQLGYWAKRITERFPDISPETLIKALQNGTEGKYKAQYEPNVNLSIIIGWIERFLKEESESKIVNAKKSYEDDCKTAFDMMLTIDQYYKKIMTPDEYLKWKNSAKI